MSEPSVSAGYAKGLVELAVSRGADREALAARAGIDASALDDLNARVPFERYVTLMRAAKAVTDDPALALHYGEAANLGQFSVVGLIGHASETMGEAFRQLNRYVRLVVDVECGPERFQIVRDRRGLWLVDTRKRPNDFFELTESAFAQMFCTTKSFGERAGAPEVHVTHADPGYRAEYERIFQARIVFGSKWNAYRFDPAWIDAKVAALPRYVGDVLNDHADSLLKDLDAGRTIRGSVERLIEQRLASSGARIDDLAAGLNMSRQTLYRRLKAEGTTFEQVLDEVRRRLALRDLADPKLPVTEVAYRLGFADPSAFSRAFKRWTGINPRAARKAGLK